MYTVAPPLTPLLKQIVVKNDEWDSLYCVVNETQTLDAILLFVFGSDSWPGYFNAGTAPLVSNDLQIHSMVKLGLKTKGQIFHEQVLCSATSGMGTKQSDGHFREIRPLWRHTGLNSNKTSRNLIGFSPNVKTQLYVLQSYI